MNCCVIYATKLQQMCSAGKLHMLLICLRILTEGVAQALETESLAKAQEVESLRLRISTEEDRHTAARQEAAKLKSKVRSYSKAPLLECLRHIRLTV